MRLTDSTIELCACEFHAAQLVSSLSRLNLTLPQNSNYEKKMKVVLATALGSLDRATTGNSAL